MEFVSGRNVVKELIRSGTHIRKLYVEDSKLKGQAKDILAEAQRRGIEIQEVPKDQLDGLVEGLTQGLVAEINDYKTYDLVDILAGGPSRLMVLDQIEDPHNLGAIIRTAEAAGFDSLIVQKRRSAAISNTVHRSSAGASFHMKVCQVTNISQAIRDLKENGFWIYGADGQADQVYTDVDLTGKLALVIGSEGKGLSRLVKENCDVLMRIPMLGQVQSLNASNAAAILAYEVVRQNGQE